MFLFLLKLFTFTTNFVCFRNLLIICLEVLLFNLALKVKNLLIPVLEAKCKHVAFSNSKSEYPQIFLVNPLF